MASLARSTEKCVHYWQRLDIWPSSVKVKHMKSLCSNYPPRAQMQASRRVHHCLTASSMINWSPGWNVPTFRPSATSADNVMNSAAAHTLLQLSPDPIVYRVEVRTVVWPESLSDEVWCFTGLQLHCLVRLWAGALSCQQTSLPD